MGICKSVSLTKKVITTTVSVIDERLIVRKKPVNNMGRNTGLRSVLIGASTVVRLHGARYAVGAHSANTVVYDIAARSAADVQSASTIVYALSARSAVGLKSANMVVYALGASLAAGLKSANTAVNGGIVRSVIPLDT